MEPNKTKQKQKDKTIQNNKKKMEWLRFLLYIASRDHTFPVSITTRFFMFACLLVIVLFLKREG